MTDKQQEFCNMLLASTKSLEEKKDELWDLPDEELAFLLERFNTGEHHEICCTIRAVLNEKRLDPESYRFLGLE